MKKLWKSRKWRRWQEKRRRKAAKQRRHRGRRRLGPARRAPRPVRVGRSGPVRLAAPPAFSMVENTEETIRFLDRITFHLDRKDPVFIDLSGVTTMTIDAIVLLISKLKRGRRYAGNFPANPSLRKRLEESGFMGHVHGDIQIAKEAHGALQRQGDKRADPRLADQLVSFVTAGIYGVPRWAKPTQRTLVECMTNTRQHASGQSGAAQRWWLMGYYDEDAQKGLFAFVDQGVGISASLRLKFGNRFLRGVGLRDNAQILRDVFAGKIGSRTQLPHRGLGLPDMKRNAESGGIRALRVICNDVYADVTMDEYRELPVHFRGTLVSFELGHTMERPHDHA
jgi:hypothetical protein